MTPTAAQREYLAQILGLSSAYWSGLGGRGVGISVGWKMGALALAHFAHDNFPEPASSGQPNEKNENLKRWLEALNP